CDDKDHTGRVKPVEEERSTYSHAMKIRAALTFLFSRIGSIGLTPWHLSPDQTKGIGNPSVSFAVSSYMISLRRRKAADGEAPTSARAMTPEVMQRLYEFNHRPENWSPRLYAPAQPGETPVAPGMRRLLLAVYTICFVCMLRSDEGLNIKVRNLSLAEGGKALKLTLDTRKTHQHGGIEPFVAHRLHKSEKHLCFVRAVSEWIKFAGIDLKDDEAYLFPKLGADGKPVKGERHTRMTSEAFLEAFRNNLVDIGIVPRSYGTHSFRRGGCQWLACDKRWPLRRICDWGGWSTEFSSMTIVKYLISWNDDPRERREDYLNPNRPPIVACPLCGRTCACS
ncbi:hypothetical protein EXIGLDRAFT_810520, partial [Exidia glandulosa HHB12029]